LKRLSALSRDSPSFRITSANPNTSFGDEEIRYSPAIRLSSFIFSAI
jgi:hypothetical protein